MDKRMNMEKELITKRINNDYGDTIAAISTGMAAGGIGIVRISGPEAIECADLLFRPAAGSEAAEASEKRKLSSAPSHTVHYGHIVWQDEVLDEVLVTVMRAPRT